MERLVEKVRKGSDVSIPAAKGNAGGGVEIPQVASR